MDLRIVKTRLSIKKAFLKLLGKSRAEEIKVKDICDEAKINKTTFYKHYHDSSDLMNEIENRAVDKIVDKFEERELLFADTKAYMASLYYLLEREIETLRLIFKGKTEVFCAKLEERLKSFYPAKDREIEQGVVLSFVLGGCLRVVRDYLFSDAHDAKTIVECTSAIANNVIDEITE